MLNTWCNHSTIVASFLVTSLLAGVPSAPISNCGDQGSGSRKVGSNYNRRQYVNDAIEKPVQTKEVRINSKRVEWYVNACFEGLFRPAPERLLPGFVIGDFDGDSLQDIFVPVQLSRKIRKQERSKASFELQGVLDSGSPASEALDFSMSDLDAWEGGPFLMVIHRAFKHRCSAAGNRVILLIPVERDARSLKLYRSKKLPAGTIGDPTEDQPPPQLKGDAILLLNSDGAGVALYWDGERYRWYPYDPPQRDQSEASSAG